MQCSSESSQMFIYVVVGRTETSHT